VSIKIERITFPRHHVMGGERGDILFDYGVGQHGEKRKVQIPVFRVSKAQVGASREQLIEYVKANGVLKGTLYEIKVGGNYLDAKGPCEFYGWCILPAMDKLGDVLKFTRVYEEKAKR
jgi:hypothetical protein